MSTQTISKIQESLGLTVLTSELKEKIISEYEKSRVTPTSETALIIANYKAAQKKKAELAKSNRSYNTKNRLKVNNDVRSDLMSFEDVFSSFVRVKFSFLTSRPTIQKINDNFDDVQEVFAIHCSDKMLSKASNNDVTIDWERLPRLITDKKLVLTFASKAQKVDGKVWSATAIIDIIMKALTTSNPVYEAGLKLRNAK